MAAVLFLLPHPKTTFLTFAMTAMGGILYLLVLMAIDREMKNLITSIMQIVRIRG
jgi:hypothetical protein